MDLLFILLSLCLCFLFLIFLHRFIHRPTATSKLPPGPSGLPILGSLLQLGARPHESMSKLSKLHGPLMTLHLGFLTTVVASSPETAKEILLTHDKNLSDRTIPHAVTSQPNIEATIAWASGDQRWRNRRRICSTQMFTTQRLNSLQHLRHDKVENLVKYIKKCAVTGAVVDIGQVAFATSLNLISSTIFSIDMVDPDFETAQEFKDLVWRIMEDAGKLNLSDYFPMLGRLDLQGVQKHIKQAYVKLHEIFDDIIERRLESKEKFGDFLDVLLEQCQVDGSAFTRHTIKPMILDLFIAGSDTSAITTEWGMAELLKNPEMLRKAQKELNEVIGIEGAVKESDIAQLPYLQAVVKETMRLHPVVPLLLPYKATNDVEVQGYTIPRGTQVLVNAWSISTDPKYWTDPTSFNPDRFLHSDIDYKGRDFQYIPFGAGRRICPGLPLAIRMVHLMLASIIHGSDWKLPEGMRPTDLDMKDQFGVTLKKAVPLCAKPVLA